MNPDPEIQQRVAACMAMATATLGGDLEAKRDVIRQARTVGELIALLDTMTSLFTSQVVASAELLGREPSDVLATIALMHASGGANDN